jgi:hydroxypyruvate isomerase
MIRWSLNISMLLKEYDFLDRFRAAADLGFGAVEFWWPAGIDLNALVKAREAAGVQVALFNADGGNLAAGERGFLGNPDRADYVRENFTLALDLAETLRCPLIHVLGGNIVAGMTRDEQLAQAAALQGELCAQAAERGITVTLEPQNQWDAPYYLFTHTAEALAQIEAVGAPNLKLQYDIYHMQLMEGNIVNTLRRSINQIAHIQIADVPGRHQPGTGELNYPYIFSQIDAMGYDGYIGLEYNPVDGDTAASLAWLPKEHRAGM